MFKESEFFGKVFGGADVVSSSGEGSYHRVLSRLGSRGAMVGVEVGVCGFSIDGGGVVRVDKHVKVGDSTIFCRVFNSIL